MAKPVRAPQIGPASQRDPKDITFVNPSDGTAETFIKTRNLY
jgi:hypothetical protein